MTDHVGTKVSIPGTRGQGILRYQGPIRGKNGIFCGIELIGPIAALRGKNSGSVDGIQYFEVQNPMTGLFLPFERLKSANSHLTSSLRLSSGIRSTPSSEIISTPSPLARGRSGSTTPSGNTKNGVYHSPYSEKSLVNRNLLNGKQRNIRPSSRGLSGDSTSSLNTTETSSTNFDIDRINLEKELKEVKEKYENSQLEMNEKMKILNDLRTTVNEIQPLLEEYENSLSEKDKKLLKQRSEFEKAREEWRQSLDLMVSTQQENEEYYEQRISDLSLKIEDLSKTNLSDRNTELTLVEGDNQPALLLKDTEISNYKIMVEQLQSEKSEIEKKLNEKVDSQKLEIDKLTKKLSSSGDMHNNGKIETMQKELDELRAKYISVKSESERLQSEIIAKDKIIQETTLAKPKTDNEFNSLLQDLKSISLNDNSDETSKDHQQSSSKESNSQRDLESKIVELENQLEMRPTFEELTDLQNTIDELDSLHKQEIEGKDDFIKALLKEKEDLQLQISNILQNIEKEDKSVNQSKKTEINTISKDGELPVYIPSKPIDPSSGKADWCGLCERDGHSSINCPYENDMF